MKKVEEIPLEHMDKFYTQKKAGKVYCNSCRHNLVVDNEINFEKFGLHFESCKAKNLLGLNGTDNLKS
jgi:hypothetical protein